MPATVEPFFLQLDSGPFGSRFALLHHPVTPVARGLVLHVHAFAEEMNKTRRMSALQARAFASRGYAVLQPDLLGCGDSAGDFGDASWEGWVDDIVFAARWLQQRFDSPLRAPLWLWGVRGGSLVACDAARRLAAAGIFCRMLLWQPTTSGRVLLQQFLRLKAAAELSGGQARGVTERLRQLLAAGQPVEVAGYTIAPALATGLDAGTLAPPAAQGHATWLETIGEGAAGPSPGTTLAANAWQAAGWRVQVQAVKGPPFWQTAEISEVPALIDASLQAVTQCEQGAGDGVPAGALGRAIEPRGTTPGVSA